ncbi:transglutaminase-like domain-containing protein [Pararhodobacter zhoushanensis]|uniref:transglutaminase-like domain-containing protein n=1 Tax=Pararhodobacter zhoushanensis TaxID=2479545 RepID=UPI000F8CBB27|nr:transglutaminase family protein [Pararhodobacter zhoushanensis]
MRITLGCRLTYQLTQATPMIVMLNMHYSRFGDLERPDYLTTIPAVPLESYRDRFENWCVRLVAPEGQFTLTTDGICRDAGLRDPVPPMMDQHAVQDLPSETLVYLLGSRYCDTDLLSDQAWQLFGNGPTGTARVQAICDYVHNHIRFGYEHARATRTASQALAEGHGVCRDYTHLAITLCRCMNIPARYCTGYLSDIGEPLPHPPGDFAAWMEVYLGGQWWMFDPRNNVPRMGRVLMAQGRDAADVPLVQTFGPNTLSGFEVWTDEITDGKA